MDTKTASEESMGDEEREHSHFFKVARKVMLASVGAVAIAQDEMEDFINKLTERGELAEKDGRKLIQEMKEKRKKRAKEAREEMSQKVRESLEKMNIPSRADLEKLSSSISSLAEKIDEMAKSRK